MYRTALTIFTAAALAVVAQGMPQSKNADTRVLGIPVGEKFVVPQCEYIISKHSTIYKDFSPKVTCYTRGVVPNPKTISTPLLNNVVVINFSRDQLPVISKSFNMSAIVLNEILEGVWFDTNGLAAQREVFELLKSKYGSPSQMNEVEVKNLMGATFSSVHALWDFDNINVTFEGVTTDFKTGRVSVFTKKGMEWQERRAVAQKGQLKL